MLGRILLVAAVLLGLSGCSGLDEFNNWLNEPMEPGVVAAQNARQGQLPYTPNYTTIGTRFDTGSRGNAPVRSPSAASGGSGGGPAGQCASGTLTQCRFPDGSWGTCCASAQ